MKSSLIRSFVIFAAGAATAALASGLYPPEPITAGEFQERATKLIVEIEKLGAYVAVTENGRVGIFTNPYACMPPRPPVPVMPENAVDPRTLEAITRAFNTMNIGRMMDEPTLVYEVGLCKPYAKLMTK
jgi:hypothetical protein